jgi:hypothetical protein
MKTRKLISWAIGPALAFAAWFGVAAASAQPASHFLYTGDGLTPAVRTALARPDIDGVQIIYNWRQLEPEEGQYDFSEIERDLAAVTELDKKFWIQIQDRFFMNRFRPVPDYLQTEAIYGGGLTPQYDDDRNVQQGWVVTQWNPAVRARFQALLTALAAEFDGRVFGLNLPESAVNIDPDTDQSGFTCDAYVAASLENIGAARAAFQQSHVVQYANFWPCEWNNDKGYMQRAFEDAEAKGYGMGGPDIAPNRRGQMRNSYPFFNAFHERLPIVAMAIQEPTLAYRNPETGAPFTRTEFVDFAENYLGVDVIFWSVAAPWISEPLP